VANSSRPSRATTALPPPTEFCTQGFEIATTQISPEGLDFGIDYEFDEIGYRAQWRKGRILRVIDIDPVTGLPAGTPTIVDADIATTWPAAGDFLFGGDGAEWAYSERGSEFFYMRPYGFGGRNRRLVKAYESSPGQWATEPLSGATSSGFPLGSRNPSDNVPRILFLKRTWRFLTFDYELAIRDVPESSQSEWSVPAPFTLGERGPGWAPGRRPIVMSLLDATGMDRHYGRRYSLHSTRIAAYPLRPVNRNYVDLRGRYARAGGRSLHAVAPIK
jgi:hypothetical protein